MDKVIIDGVDVSGCEFCSATGQCKIQQVFQRNEIVGIIEKPYGVHLECNLCDKDCYYKQLKRLQHYQAEFEHELMNDYTYDGYISPNGFTPIDVIKHIKSELKRLEQENEKLRANIYPQTNYTTQQFYTKEEYEKLQQENERLKEEKGGMQILIDNYIALTEKYRQALQEIREIAEKMYNTNDEDTERDLHIELQAKINEVIGAE